MRLLYVSGVYGVDCDHDDADNKLWEEVAAAESCEDPKKWKDILDWRACHDGP